MLLLKTHKKAWISVTLSLLLAGCGAPPSTVFRSDSSMADIYYGDDNSGRDTPVKRRAIVREPVRRGAVKQQDMAGYTRTAEREINNLFPTLPNPILVMYVFPHVSGGAPVPGYATRFSMYPADQFAMPGEVD